MYLSLPALSRADLFSLYLERWLGAAEANSSSEKSQVRIAMMRQADLRAEPLNKDNLESVTELVAQQFRLEPMTIAFNIKDDILRGFIGEVLQLALADDSPPSLVVLSHGEPCSVGICVPFEEHSEVPPGFPRSAQQLFNALNLINQHAIRRRRRLNQPLQKPFEYIFAATSHPFRLRIPVGERLAAASLFQATVLCTMELAWRSGYQTLTAHTNDRVTRSCL